MKFINDMGGGNISDTEYRQNLSTSLKQFSNQITQALNAISRKASKTKLEDEFNIKDESSRNSSSSADDSDSSSIIKTTNELNDSHIKKDKSTKKCNRDEDEDIICSGESEAQIQEQSLHSIYRMPPFNNQRQAGVIRDYLYNGSSFSGYQNSRNESYEVNVKIQYIDHDDSYLCGYLCINHLTKDHPSLTTFFEGEIISEKHGFLTRKWETTEAIDRAHWSKFEEFDRKFKRNFNLDSFNYEDLNKSDYIYMRWKEHFLVPDHTITKVDGANYDGFYYVCYSKHTSSIRGYYFHINSESVERWVNDFCYDSVYLENPRLTQFLSNKTSFQSLNLELDRQGTTQVFEFR